MKIRLKHLIIFALAALAIAAYVGAGSAADGPTAYVRYNGDVSVSVYWDDAANAYNCYWANDVLDSGADLQWSGAMGPENLSGSTRWVTLAAGNVTKYKNYYFKITDGSNTTIVRVFPVDYNNVTNPNREQNDYAHGNFTPDTGMCAACHVTHTALKAQLLKQATYYELCLLCHGSSASQSKYDVVTGAVYTADGWKASLAGPIGTGVGTITSKHNVDDTVNTATYVPGSDTGLTLTFTCVSCHNGHGGKNDNYRLLKKTVYPADNKWNPQTVNFAAYAVVKDASVGEEVYMVSGNTEFCAACHLDYDEGNAYEKGGVYGVTASVYKHPVTVGSTVYSVFATSPAKDLYPTAGDYLPLQYSATAESKTTDKRTAVVCETCHFAHGTYKTFNISLPPDGTTVSNKKMLRLDNYGVCQSCHRK